MQFSILFNKIKNSDITYKIALAVILFIGCFIRLYQLDSIPGGIHPDEAYAAYNAYSMVNYGIDTFGYHNPVYFIAWGGGMNVLNSYLMMPMIKIFGMNLWTIRLPQALISCLTIFVFYLLVKKLYNNRNIALFAVFLLAINPWHIMMTRNNIESGLLPAFFIFGFYFFVKGLDNSKWLYASAVSYGLCLYAYAVIWPILPFIILLQTIYCIRYKKIKISDIHLWMSALVLVIMAVPLLLFMLINYGYIEEISTSIISIPKLTAFRKGDLSLQKIPTNLMTMLRMFDMQQDGMAMNADGRFGFYYRFSNVFIVMGICLIFNRAYQSLKNKTFCASDMLAIQFSLIFILGMIILNPHATRLNCIHAIFIVCIALGIYWLSDRMWKQFKYVMLILYLFAFYSFVMFYKKDYNTKVRELYQPGIDYCMEDIEQLDGKVYIDSRISYSVILYYTKMPVNEFISTVKYDDITNPYMEAQSYGRFVTIHTDKEEVTSLSDYTGLGDGIYIVDVSVKDELLKSGYKVTAYGDYCVAYK
ncbi:MAG: glycosyltransferase family 39 protein [Clostridia bacterium]|nr:glycosyltransferase family 39 protein [Clostridia bacterium]